MRRVKTLRVSMLEEIGRAQLSIDIAAYVLSDPESLRR